MNADDVLTKLTKERKRKGMSQMHVAWIMGTTQSHVSDLENGKVSPHFSTVERYATAIGVQITFQSKKDQK